MMNRRDFFRVVAAGGATAAATGCQRTTETILPLVVPNEQLVPGVAAWFATVCRECPAGCGVIARNREGRVVKLEGNPDHPVNQGALCARGQAALQGLYHPDRFAGPLLRDGGALKPASWDVAQKVVADKIGALRSARKGGAIALDRRAIRVRGAPRSEPDHVRPRRDPVLRLRGRAGRGVLRRGLPRDVAVERELCAHVRADAHVPRRP